MTTLIKLSNVSFTPGSPHVPGFPGQAARPGYFITRTFTERVPTYGEIWAPDRLSWRWGIIGFRNDTTTVRQWVPEVLFIPPSPSRAAIPPITTDLNIGWNGGADTVDRFTDSLAFSFTVPSAAVGVVVGLSSASANGNYRTIRHGFYASRGSLRVIELGMLGPAAFAYNDATPLVITRLAGNITYSVGGVVVATSESTLSEVALGTAALYAPGDAVVNASVRQLRASATVTLEPLLGVGHNAPWAEATVVLQPVTTSIKMRSATRSNVVMEPITTLIGAQGRTSGSAAVLMQPIEGAASGRPITTSAVVMEPVEIVGADRAYTEASVTLEQITSLAFDGGLTPDFAASITSLAYITSAVLMSTRVPLGINVALQPILSLSANRQYGESTTSFEPIETEGYEFFDIVFNEIVAPSPTLRADGRDMTGANAADLSAPPAGLSFFGGANAELTAPHATLAITGTVTNFGHASLRAPVARLLTTGVVSGTGATSPFFEAPMGALIGYGGAVASITLTGRAQLEATGTAGVIGSATLTAPLFELVASGTAQNYGGANLIAPSPKLGGQGQAWLIAPMGRLVAIGSATITATFDAYAVNLNHPPRRPGQEEVDQVTRYTNFPFTHIVRYQGSYFGAAPDGLYLLEGTTDAGTAIPYNVRTCLSDFDTSAQKTVVSAYFGARLGPEAVVSLHAGEKTPNVYTYSTPRGATAQNHRQVFGRGVKERYFALGVSGANELELDSIEFELAILTRRI